MTSGMRRLALILLAVLCAVVVMPIMAVAQVPPPTLTTTINPPPANQPFEAAFSIFASPESIGFGATPQINVVGNIIVIQFLAGCSAPCAPRSYTAFPFTMPALPAGNYRVRFGFYLPSPPLQLAELSLTVGGAATPVAVPSMSTRWLAVLALLLVVVGTGLLQRRPFRSHS